VTDTSERETDVYVIGDVNPDILVIGGDVVPEFGQVEKYVGNIRLTVGGSSAITACGLARLGLRVAHGGVIGDDILGHSVLEALRDRGVDGSTVTVDPAIPTGATVHLGSGDDRAMLTATGTINRLRSEDVPREIGALRSDSPNLVGRYRIRSAAYHQTNSHRTWQRVREHLRRAPFAKARRPVTRAASDPGEVGIARQWLEG
jgi:hypothetical protein